jgi:hypothetical protein
MPKKKTAPRAAGGAPDLAGLEPHRACSLVLTKKMRSDVEASTRESFGVRYVLKGHTSLHENLGKSTTAPFSYKKA